MPFFALKRYFLAISYENDTKQTKYTFSVDVFVRSRYKITPIPVSTVELELNLVVIVVSKFQFVCIIFSLQGFLPVH